MSDRLPPVVTRLPEIGITVISRWLFTCYLVHDGGAGRPFLVDVGMPSHVATAGGELRRIGSDLAELGSAIATHGHGDHVGGLPALREHSHAEVCFPAELRPIIETGEFRSPGPREVARILPVMADQPFDLGALKEVNEASGAIGYGQSGPTFPFEPAHWLADGDTLPGHPDWQVLATPGHVDDSTCLYNARTRTLLSGDTILSVGGKAWFNPEYVDEARSADTEARLRPLDVEHLLPGHGRIVTGPRVLDEALSFRERPPRSGALRSLRAILRSHRSHRHP